MCGIAGLWNQHGGETADSLRQIATRMADSLRHRGPDGGAIWLDDTAGLALAHRRLAIIDLSAAANQPMVSADGRTAIVFNGEIYNYAALAEALRAAGHAVPGNGDTAALLAALSVWGVAATLPRLSGIFAFAFWERETQTLTLARDHLGVKPLYWSQRGQDFFFASELRALLQHPACPHAINPMALGAYFRSGNVPAPHCIFSGIQKLPPASYLTCRVGEEPELTRYWDLTALALQPPDMTLSYEQATTQLHDLLRHTVRDQMVSDVPLGALLSGGIDSTLVTALMQAQSQQPIRSFSIGFDNADFDEAPFARAIAAHLGTDHTETYVTATEAQEVIPLLPEIYDEPFADSSQIPTYLVAKIARQQVTVALSGDGGDEGFLGYNRYRAWEQLEAYPDCVWPLVAKTAGLLSAEQWNKLGQRLPARFRVPQLGDKLVKFAALGSGDVAEAYRSLTSWWQAPEQLMAEIPPLPAVLPYPVPDDPVAAMQLWDTLGYLPDDVLTKVDRASMAVALEVRVPLLDPQVIAFGWRAPRAYKLEKGVTKRLLRSVLNHYVPAPLLERPKSGFGVPLAAWLRGPLRDWAEHLLAEPTLDDAGLEPAPIRAVWAAHCAEQGNHQHQLWTVLMYVAWRQHWNVYG